MAENIFRSTPSTGAVLPTNRQLALEQGLPQDIYDTLTTPAARSYTPSQNKVLVDMVNKLVMTRVQGLKNFSNPFVVFDGSPITYGEAYEKVFVEQSEGWVFGTDGTDPFKPMSTKVQSRYVKRNYEMQYGYTIRERELAKACFNEYGLINLIDKIAQTVRQQMELDEYFAQIAYFGVAEYYANGFEEIDVSTLKTEQEKYKKVTQTLGDVIKSFTFPNTLNSAIHRMQVCPKENIVIVAKASTINKINYEYLAGVYNLSKVELSTRIIEIESFVVNVKQKDGTYKKMGEDLDFIVIDKDCLDNHLCLREGGMIYNPKDKYSNHFLDNWKIFNFDTFYNARAFKIKNV